MTRAWATWTAVAGLLADGARSLAGATVGRLPRFVDDAHDVENTAASDCEDSNCNHTWEQSTDDDGENVHVTPIRDCIEHTYADDCVCGPTTTPVFRPDGSNGWLHTHHALHQREANA